MHIILNVVCEDECVSVLCYVIEKTSKTAKHT